LAGGARLEDAATIKFAAENLMPAPNGGDGNGCVWGTVLIDTKGFVNGIFSMVFLSVPLACVDTTARLRQQNVLL
jgi:hypothetical protein